MQLITGCVAEPTGGPAEPGFDSAQARDLERHEPPIRLADDDLSAGRRLVAFRLESPEATIRAQRAYPSS